MTDQPDSRDVERVARAIACVRHGGEPNEEMADFMWIAYVDDARAAIATTGARVAMLEETLRAIDKAIDKARDMVPDDGTGDDAALPFCCVLNQAQLDARAARDR